MASPDELLTALSLPAAYPFEVEGVVVHQTHISMVFLAGEAVYKVKKPVQLGFLDFSTLEKRRHYCEEEVRLNRRLAPHIYLGVVPIARAKNGIRVEGDGEIIDWAVKMRRLPEGATLESRLEKGLVTPGHLASLAQRLAGFHATARTSAHIASLGGYETLARNIEENFEQTAGHRSQTVSESVWQRVRDQSFRFLEEHEMLIRERQRLGKPRDTHGDLHLDHVYHFPEQAAPQNWVIVDCIEFNERFRYADPVADVAFLTMDLAYHGRRDLAEHLAKAYFAEARDAEGSRLLPLYSAYRAVVRGKVEGLKSLEKEVPEVDRRDSLESAKTHWLLAFAELSLPRERPGIVVVCGLPGTGKSTLSRSLAEKANCTGIRSDAVRKELGAAIALDALYSPEATRKTYQEVMRRAEEVLWQGGRALLDANFRREWQRDLVRDVASRPAGRLWNWPIRACCGSRTGRSFTRPWIG